jgi:hypothetical protein
MNRKKGYSRGVGFMVKLSALHPSKLISKVTSGFLTRDRSATIMLLHKIINNCDCIGTDTHVLAALPPRIRENETTFAEPQFKTQPNADFSGNPRPVQETSG